MRPFATLLVIVCFTLATVGSDGQQHHQQQQQQRHNSINTLRTSISINDINNIAASSNYTKKLLKTTQRHTNNNNNNNSKLNANSLNTTIVMPTMDSNYSSTSASTSSKLSTTETSSSSTSSSSPLSAATSSPSSSYSSATPLPVIKSAGAGVGAGEGPGPLATESLTQSSVYRDKRGASLDPAEIARQNQITQQILSNYLERRLFPERSVSQKIPTIADILPKPTISTTTTRSPRQKPRPRGFSVSSSSSASASLASLRKGSMRRKTYGQSKKPNALQHVWKPGNNRSRFNNDNDNDDDTEEQQPIDEEPQEEPEPVENIDVETETDDQSNNKTLSYEDIEDEELRDDEEDDFYDAPASQPRYTSRHQQRYRYSRRPAAYHHRYSYYDDDIEQDGQESLQSVESEQHDRYYRTKGDIFSRDPSENEIDSDCPHCVDETQYMNKWTMPLLKLGEKRYYLGIFFKANWFKATQYCRYHGMHLASISSQEENDRLEKHIKDFGLGHEHFWISGTDLADEGNFFWMATGRPITFTNWNAGEPNNFRYENGEEENCLELWNRDGKGLKWNDSPCSFETYFVCEVQP